MPNIVYLCSIIYFAHSSQPNITENAFPFTFFSFFYILWLYFLNANSAVTSSHRIEFTAHLQNYRNRFVQLLAHQFFIYFFFFCNPMKSNRINILVRNYFGNRNINHRNTATQRTRQRTHTKTIQLKWI